jgi:hypothetical protein
MENSDETASVVLGRIKKISAGAYVAFAMFSLISSGFTGFLALTCSALVIMICFLWLEGMVNALLQPSPHLKPWRVVVRTLARYVLFGAALAVTILVARFDALSVLLGFSIVVVGIMGEALYSTYRSFTE